MIKALREWWFRVQWKRRLRKDKREGRWPI